MAKASSQSSGEETNQTPLPSYPPRAVFSTQGNPKASTSPTDATGALRGQGTPSSPSRTRITPLSWACTSAAGPGRQAMPSATRASRWPVGTCSWSKVNTSQPRETARSTSRSR